MKLIINNFKAPSTNKMYSGQHWSKRYALAKTIQHLVFGLCLEQKIKPVKKYPVDIMITAYYKAKTKRDSGNVSNKELVDGLVLAKVIEDDDTRFVRYVTTRAIIGKKEDKVIVEIVK